MSLKTRKIANSLLVCKHLFVTFTEATNHKFAGSIHLTYSIKNMILFIINERL